jgi:hypothetical protein
MSGIGDLAMAYHRLGVFPGIKHLVAKAFDAG